MASLTTLPQDLVIEVLSRLPVKSLLRFRSVCKTWLAMIENPSFIAKHATFNKKECILVKRFLEQSNQTVLSFVSDETLDFTPAADIDVPFLNDKYLQLLGPCNGIVCLTSYNDDNGDIVLCNPAVREFKLVPAPRFTYGPGLLTQESGTGFGFDRHTNDIKVVRIFRLYEADPSYVYHCDKAVIYNSSKDCWRKLDDITPSVIRVGIAVPYGFAQIFNGAFHWYAIDYTKGAHELILSFHMTSEVFEEIPLPDVCARLDGKSRALAVLHESLAFIHMDSYYDIWVMNEYGVKESWTKQFTIGPLSGIDYPLSFWNSDQLLLQGSNGYLISCDLNTHKIKEFQAHGDPNTLWVVIYTQSLVSIKRESGV